jgi:DNA-binding transcriptional ArsR family regulator
VRARLQLALGPLAEAMNAGQVYVVLNRLEKAGLVASARVGQTRLPDRKVYELTADGRARVMEWLADTSWPKPAPAEFHLKLVAAAAAGLADPVRLVDAQRHALLAGLASACPPASAPAAPWQRSSDPSWPNVGRGPRHEVSRLVLAVMPVVPTVRMRARA